MLANEISEFVSFVAFAAFAFVLFFLFSYFIYVHFGVDVFAFFSAGRDSFCTTP